MKCCPKGVDECFNLYFISKEENEDLYRRNIGRIYREKEAEALREVKKLEVLRRKAANKR